MSSFHIHGWRVCGWARQDIAATKYLEHFMGEHVYIVGFLFTDFFFFFPWREHTWEALNQLVGPGRFAESQGRCPWGEDQYSPAGTGVGLPSSPGGSAF